jgi:hypothetical protein
VRSDFAAPLNSDQGWAGALSENVSVAADTPFRLRFEVERPAASTGSGQFRLQVRRNQGDWTNVEAHDFPHPERELTLAFAKGEVGAKPDGWSDVHGNARGMIVAADGQQRILRARADHQPLIALYTPPWDTTELTAEFRLAPDNRIGVGFIFGYVDRENHFRLFLDAAAGAVRLSRVVSGAETVLAERKAAIASGQWLDMELQTENGEVEVNFENDTLEFSAALGTDIPQSRLGFTVPANSGAEFRAFTFAGEARTPRVSIVSCPAYVHGAATANLLPGSAAGFQPGVGVGFAERTPAGTAAGSHGEFEWALVIRRFADGAATNEEGDSFELRMVDGDRPVTTRNPVLRLTIPAGHVGGTFVENPGRIGPWHAANGDLYFIMEPAETDNLFMMIKSADNGRTWREVDAANRPETNDLESVDTRQVGDTIHILHQVTSSSRYHAFRTSDHPTHPDTWAVRDEVAGRVEAIAQTATLEVRSDGSMVAFYLGPARIHYSVRSAAGAWSEVRTLDPGTAPNQAGPQAVLGANDTIHLAYYGTDGTIWYRRFLPTGTLTAREQLATGAGTSRAEYGAVLPLVYIPESDTVVIIYRLDSGTLWERRVVNGGRPTPARQVTNRIVTRDAVDSQQPGADASRDGSTVHVLFIEEPSRSIFSTNDKGGWQPAKLLVGDIAGSWVRGNIYTRRDGARVYGYIYDAGSDGGAGMNRFGELILNAR